MVQNAGYLVDLRGIQFEETAEGTATSWVHAMAPGTYHHPVYGKMDITLDRVRRFAQSVKDRVRGIDLDIDYDHKQRTGEAAGWVRNAEARADGLWLLVEWTREAAQKIKDKAYRYFSPEFTDEWEHPESKVKFQDVLLGGGITNRPFLKNLIPINLSEAFASEDSTQGGQMDPKKLRELLGLPEDATDEQVTTKLTELSEGGFSGESQNQLATAQLSEEVQSLIEKNPAIKALAEQLEASNKQLAEQAAAIRLGEVTTQVAQLSETARTKINAALPPAVSEELKAAMLLAPKSLAEKFYGAIVKLAETGFVSLGEKGESNPENLGENNDASKKFGEAVAKKIKDSEGKLSYADAALAVADENPKLFDEYQNASYAFKA